MKQKVKGAQRGVRRKENPFIAVSVHLEQKVLDKYDKEATRLGVSRASLVRQALTQMLPTIEFRRKG